jgi:hypothetical protein
MDLLLAAQVVAPVQVHTVQVRLERQDKVMQVDLQIIIQMMVAVEVAQAQLAAPLLTVPLVLVALA